MGRRCPQTPRMIPRGPYPKHIPKQTHDNQPANSTHKRRCQSQRAANQRSRPKPETAAKQQLDVRTWVHKFGGPLYKSLGSFFLPGESWGGESEIWVHVCIYKIRNGPGSLTPPPKRYRRSVWWGGGVRGGVRDSRWHFKCCWGLGNMHPGGVRGGVRDPRMICFTTLSAICLNLVRCWECGSALCPTNLLPWRAKAVTKAV